MRTLKTIIAASLAAGLIAAPALADRLATPEEANAVSSVVSAAGFTKWSTIELDDDGHWDVENAVAGDGKIYDLDIRDGKIISQELETN